MTWLTSSFPNKSSRHLAPKICLVETWGCISVHLAPYKACSRILDTRMSSVRSNGDRITGFFGPNIGVYWGGNRPLIRTSGGHPSTPQIRQHDQLT